MSFMEFFLVVSGIGSDGPTVADWWSDKYTSTGTLANRELLTNRPTDLSLQCEQLNSCEWLKITHFMI